MNKTDLIASVASKSALSKKDAEKAVNAFVDSIEEALKAGEKVSIVGFGSFEAFFVVEPKTNPGLQILGRTIFALRRKPRDFEIDFVGGE